MILELRRLLNHPDRFDKEVGLENLKLSHCNDSQTEFNSSRPPRPYWQGKIGLTGFKALLTTKNST